MFEAFTNLIPFRRLRSGATYSQYYVVPNPDFDLDALGLAAAENEEDEPPVCTDEEGDDDVDWEDERDEPPLASAPPTPAASRTSLSPLSSLSPSPASTRPPSPAPPASAPHAPLPRAIKGGGRKRRKKAHGRDMRAKRRKADPSSQPERKKRHAQHITQAKAKRVEFDLRKARVASTGFRGLYEEEFARTHTLRELLEDGFTYYGYSGSETVPIVAPLAPEPSPGAPADAPAPEPEDVVVACLLGRPKDGEGSGHGDQVPFEDAHKSLASAIETTRESVSFTKAAREHRRGHFGAQAEGISHGGGQLRPARLKHTPSMTIALAFLISLPAMVRIAHFASVGFGNWAPEIHEYYANTLTALLASDPALFPNFPRSVWACITINFGPRTVTFPHRDYGNLPFGWCAITALGDYDPDAGGHLVLWDCKMVIRFPAGTTVLIPSAILRHSNTRVANHERRYSVTQYSAGAIFRWVDHGFQLDEEYYASLSKEQRAKEKVTAAGRWRRGRAMFAKLKGLVQKAEGE
ncbi:hypothetical protein FB107DRAFT_280175 [Schizophyllum commune]